MSFASYIFFAVPAAATLQVPCCANRPSQRNIFLSVTDKKCQEQARRLLKPVSRQISRYLCAVLDTPLALVPILYQRVFRMIWPTGRVSENCDFLSYLSKMPIWVREIQAALAGGNLITSAAPSWKRSVGPEDALNLLRLEERLLSDDGLN
ncbi:hypothetical protein AAES_131799 [Amazona aestiva]|uniref:Uncharacterized protein n=1 Tax=Amazona aestiva TaxID=12930 RepID=A0A0Q3P7C4_AMAAE|nr:hypothetical protein AAES_131799 [Amazona aestiva]